MQIFAEKITSQNINSFDNNTSSPAKAGLKKSFTFIKKYLSQLSDKEGGTYKLTRDEMYQINLKDPDKLKCETEFDSITTEFTTALGDTTPFFDKNIYVKLSDKYHSLKKYLAEKYKGEELDDHYDWIEERYDAHADAVSAELESELSRGGMVYCTKMRLNNIILSHGYETYNDIKIANLDFDEDKFQETMFMLMTDIYRSSNLIAEKAKEYIKEEEAISFDDFVSEDSETRLGRYSLDDITGIMIAATAARRNDREEVDFALKVLMKVDFSDELKKIIVGFTAQRMDLLVKGEVEVKTVEEMVSKYEEAISE